MKHGTFEVDDAITIVKHRLQLALEDWSKKPKYLICKDCQTMFVEKSDYYQHRKRCPNKGRK